MQYYKKGQYEHENAYFYIKISKYVSVNEATESNKSLYNLPYMYTVYQDERYPK
jgi:hypothetical protein